MHTQIRRRIREACCVAMLVVMGSACIPRFENALPIASGSTPDPALLGTWMSTDGKAQASFFPRTNGWLDIVHIADIEGASDRCDITPYEGYTVLLGKEQFLCFRGIAGSENADAATNGFWLAQYRVRGGTLLDLTLFADDPVQALIESGKLAGTVTASRGSDDVTVTASSVQLADVLQTEGAAAFVDTNAVMRFVKLVPATR